LKCEQYFVVVAKVEVADAPGVAYRPRSEAAWLLRKYN